MIDTSIRKVSSKLPARIRCISAVFIVLGIAQLPALHAQDLGEWEIFGSLQSFIFHQESEAEYETNEMGIAHFAKSTLSNSEERATFAMQQMDIFINKPINDQFNAFIDLEFQVNYNSDQNWGAFSVQEAWLNYAHSTAFNVKFGLQYPPFNHLNEIKNRLAILPYLFRPMVYERLLVSRFYNEDYIPEQAFLQVYGALPLGDALYFDWAAYMGNAEGSYLSKSEGREIYNITDEDFEFLGGTDPTDFKRKLYGGRIGVRSVDEHFKAGVSFTHDYNDIRDTTKIPFDFFIRSRDKQSLLGEAPRVRLGGDLLYRYGKLYFEGEYIKVLPYDYPPADKVGFNYELDFFSLALFYDLFEDLTIYSSYSRSRHTFVDNHEFRVYNTGISYRVNNTISLKTQWLTYEEESTPWFGKEETTIYFTFVGCSVLL
ncbi:MAG: hypothetical protein CL946_04795 [Ectothiorhodospiraceae bacterium]|nr:hypothetical protein [Ectothiorhodospiraceae bacterium]